MDGRIDVTTLLFLVLAVVIFLKLRSVLGRRTGHEQTRFERYKAQQEASQRNGKLAGQDKVVTLPRREREDAEVIPAPDQQARADGEQRIKEYAAGSAAVTGGLLDIVRTDDSFDPNHFLQGAKAAYEIIVTAFAEGNRRTLKDLLSPEVYEGFSSAIAERENRGEQIDQSFVGIKSADLVEAELKGGIAQLTVKFVSELISATRDKAGGVINGDPKRIREVTDIWTFAREAMSRNPNWKLVATQAAN
ncbi:MAG: Tim44/TimA family putative adaptor protein [Hyphomonadaceae bacterium]|nr:Tim44/TimA family putative adaptor protein [Hyphomonadaceae bacterium]